MSNVKSITTSQAKPTRGETIKRASDDESNIEIFHPVSSLFPPMTAGEFAELKADIKAHGQREAIWRYQGQIIDGRHRYQACEELGYEPWYKDYTGENDEPSLIAFVVSLNLKRRHLSESQRAMIAAKLANMGRGRQWDNSANSPNKKVSQRQAAHILNVGERAVHDASKVKTKGTPELVEAVESGKVAVSTAALIADAPSREQKGILLKDEKEAQAFVKKLKERKREEKRAARRLALEAAAAAFTGETVTPAPNITIHHRDARQMGDLVEPASVHLVVTSPPYNVGIEYRTHDDSMSDLAYQEMLSSVFQQCHRALVEGGRIAVVVPFGVGRNPYVPIVPIISDLLRGNGFSLRGWIVWHKLSAMGSTSWGSFRLPTNPSLRDATECIVVAHKGDGVLQVPDKFLLNDEIGKYSPFLENSDDFTELARDYWLVHPESDPRINHPAPFPVELVSRLIRLYAYPGARILDPFMGSGTTLVAAKQLGCWATGFEIDAGYCSIAEQRLK